MNTDELREYLAKEGPALLEEIKANRRKLDECPRHKFTFGPPPYRLGMKFECQNCGGKVDVTDVLPYVKGYIAAGGNPLDVVTDWDR